MLKIALLPVVMEALNLIIHNALNFTGLARTTAFGPLSKFGVSKSMQKYFGKYILMKQPFRIMRRDGAISEGVKLPSVRKNRRDFPHELSFVLSRFHQTAWRPSLLEF